MVSARLMILALAAALLAVGAWLLLFKKSDESLIRGRFAAFSKEVEKTGIEGAATAILKSQSIAKLFAESCALEIQDSSLAGTYSREEIASHAFNARRHFQSVELSFHELEIEASGDKAEARFTALLSGSGKDGEKVREARDMTASLVKVEGKWLFSAFKVREILKR